MGGFVGGEIVKVKVSVLIPAYNSEGTIKRAIESIPDCRDIEVVVWDDGSEDNTFEIARNVLEKRKGDVLIGSNHENRGVSYTVNRLLEKAKGMFVVLLGSDDWFIKERFESVMGMLNPNYDLIYFDLEINDGSVFKLEEKSKFEYCGSVKFMRREFIGDIRVDESKKASEDKYFFEELEKKNPKEMFLGIVLKHYNFPREGSLSWKQRNGLFKEGEI